MSVRAWGLSFLAVALAVTIWARTISAEDQARVDLTLADLAALSYDEIPRPDTPPILPDTYIKDTVARADGFNRGSQLLATYKDVSLPSNAATSIFTSASPHVVLISFGAGAQGGKSAPARFGAGVVVDAMGDVLTNWHLARGDAGGLVFLKPAAGADNRNSVGYAFQIVGQDETADLALLRLTGSPRGLSPMPMGDAAAKAQTNINVIAQAQGELWAYRSAVSDGVRPNDRWTDEDGAKHSATVLQLKASASIDSNGSAGGVVISSSGQLLGLIAKQQDQSAAYIAIDVATIQAFIARAVSAPQQANPAAGSSAPVKYLSAFVPDGRMVLKVPFADLDEYLITDRERDTLQMMAGAKDGATISAVMPNAAEGFSQWAITLPNKTLIYAQGQGAFPDQFSDR